MDASTLDKIRTALTEPAMAGLSDVDAAAALSARTVPVVSERMVNERTLYTELGPEMAESILQKIAGYPPLARVNTWLAPNQAGIDVGHPQSIEMIDTLVAGGLLTAAEGAAVKALAVRQVAEFPTLYEGDVHAIRAGENI